MIGLRFPGYELLPQNPIAGLIIVHGIAEHSGRYRHVADALLPLGIACFAYDQRGHGEFPGAKTHVTNFAEFATDLELVGESIRKKFPSLPLFVWGHSMGSVIVTLAALDGLTWARGIITTGCALDALPKLDGLSGIGLRLAAALAPRLRIGLGIDAALLTNDAAMQQRHQRDPLVRRSASLKLLYGFALACGTCRAHAGRITKPWLAVHGQADKVCPPSGSESLISQLGSGDKQLVIYPGLLHEIHNEAVQSRTTLFAIMSRWILDRSNRP
jgi:alpha-beta hydrolase superfamily lysophospholipase